MLVQQVYEKMEQTFKDNMPETLYLSYQELQQSLGSTAQAWEQLLDKPDFKRFIDQQLAKYLEIDARKALNQLANSPDLKSQDIAALTRIIENSKMMQQKHQTRQHIVISYMPPPPPPEDQHVARA